MRTATENTVRELRSTTISERGIAEKTSEATVSHEYPAEVMIVLMFFYR